MSALLASAPLLLRRRGALADLLPVLAFAAATGIIATVVGGAFAFADRLPAGPIGPETSTEDSMIGFLVFCAAFASALLLPSAIGFGGSAARLSLARREQDLAAMRLVGGTTGQVGGIAVLDVAAQALLGGILGILAHLAVTPALTCLDFGISPFTVGDLLLPIWGYPVLLGVMVLLAAGSAAVSLSGVILSPLGVARDSRTVRMSVIRLVIWVALILAFVIVWQVLPLLGQATGGGMAVMLIPALLIAAMVAAINIAGPFLMWVVALAVAAVAPTPSLLVGARRLAADPKAGWRAVAVVTFAIVVAGMLTVITILGDPGDEASRIMITAMRTGGLLTLGISALLAAVSTGVTQTARVIDSAPRIRAQHIAGAEVSQLHRARIMEIGIPVALSSVLGIGTALLVLLTVFGGGMSDVRIVASFLAAVLGAYALVIAAVLVSSPLVRRAARQA